MTISKCLLFCGLIALGLLNVNVNIYIHAASLRLYNGSVNTYFETPLDNPSAIYPYIDKTKNITVYAAGFKNSANGTAVITVTSTYISLNNTNVLLLNWETESQGGLPNILGYGPAVAAAKVVAYKAGEAFVTLFKNGIDSNSVHFVGHSLGAHLLGWTAETIQSNNYNISSICGLDPAGPAFGKPIGLRGLRPSQAPLVYVLHTNPGGYGTDEPCGTVDFWANCDYDGRQPGCPNGTYPPLSSEGLCSHNRPWMLLVEALRNIGAFPAASAKSCSDWESQSSSNVVINYVGDNVDPSKQGNFYFSTYATSPYSKGLNGLRPN